MRNLIQNSFLQTRVNLKDGEEKCLCILEKVITILSPNHQNIIPDKITIKNCTQIEEQIKANWTKEDRRILEDILDYLTSAGFESEINLGTEDMAAVMICARKAMLEDISDQCFYAYYKEQLRELLKLHQDKTLQAKLCILEKNWTDE